MKDETTGLRSFSGLIGHSLISCEKLSLINFQLTDSEIPKGDRQLLRKKQTYYLESENFPNDLSKHGSGSFSWAHLYKQSLLTLCEHGKHIGCFKSYSDIFLKPYIPV